MSAGRPFSIVFESASQTSRQAAIVAGLGLGASCQTLGGLQKPLSLDSFSLPPLGQIEFFMRRARDVTLQLHDFAALLRAAVAEPRT